MSWITTIGFAAASGKLRAIYERLRGPSGEVDNILAVHSLRPHTLEGHLALYKAVLHHSHNRLPADLLELIGVYVSLLNGCTYCVDHHEAGLRRLIRDDPRVEGMRRALDSEAGQDVFDDRQRAILGYAAKLTRAPAEMSPTDLEPMRRAGLDDGEILEVNQVVAYFAYANRTVLGLGVTTHGDVLGLSPAESDDITSWGHR
jgi:uncharacterized peroxidase-related enzyme